MRTRDGGFTLIETIVAIAIFALVAAAVQLALGGAWSGARRTDRHLKALTIAQSRLAETGIATPLIEGTTSGAADGGYAWSVETRPRETPDSAIGDSAATKLSAYWVTVRVSWREPAMAKDRSIEIRTLKIGRTE